MIKGCLQRICRIALFLLFAPIVTSTCTGCADDSDGKDNDQRSDASYEQRDSGGVDRSIDTIDGDSAIDAKESDSANPTIEDVTMLRDENNYSFESRLSIPSVETMTAERGDIEICWDKLTRDLQYHDIDPLNDIDNISLVRFRNLSEAEIEERLSNDDLPQSNVDGYLSFPTQNATTCAFLSDFTLFGTVVDMAEQYVVSDERVYMLLFSSGVEIGVGTRWITFITPTETSTNPTVEASSNHDILEFKADITSLIPVPVPANGPFEIDWSALTRDARGRELKHETIDQVMFGFYEGETRTSLEEKILDLELNATSLWRIKLSGGSVVDLSEATNEKGPFSGFEGDGTWVLALMNTKGQNPAPLFLTVFEPYEDDRSNGNGKDTSDTDGSYIYTDDAAIFSKLEARVSDDLATVVKVRWTTKKPSKGYILFGPSDELGSQTPIDSESSLEHEALLLGLTADTEYDFKVVLSDEDGEHESELHSVSTGSLPVELPALTVKGKGHDMFTVAPILGSTTAVIIFDPQGNIVWYRIDNRDLDIYRARLSKQGSSIIYNAASVSGDPADNSEIVRISLDGEEVTSISVPLLAHDFVEHDDGTLAAIAAEYRESNGTELRGNKIVEVSEDGTIETVWTSWDCFDPESDPGDDIEHGWTFANALDFDPDENAYYLGMRNFSSIAKIDRDSGECLWVLGSTAETISFAEGTSPFLHQHQFQVLKDSVLVFDNDGSPGTESRVIEYQLDMDTLEASEVWSYVSTPSLFTFVLGEPRRLDNGDIFINWSVAGQMERVTADGISKWRVNSDLGYAFGYNTLEDSLYRE